MSKTSQSILMLELLYSRDKISVAELATRLEDNPRNIPEYRKALEEANYIINSTRGPDGGYSLDKKCLFPAVKLSSVEQEALMQGANYLRARNDFMYSASFETAMAKISASLVRDENPVDTTVVNRFPLVMEQEEIQERYNALNECIKTKTSIEIDYLSLKNETSNRIIHPYKLFMYNNAWFVLGFDENSSEIRYFKINRIQKFKPTWKKFRVLLSYNERDYLDESGGMKQNGDWYDMKLKVTGQYAMLVRERVYGKNQQVECVDNNTTILSCKMQNKENIKVFVLGFGSHCEVLEPEWLKDDMLGIAKTLLEKYGE